MRVTLLAGVIAVVSLLTASCSSDPAPRDSHVAAGVTGSGEAQLLAAPSFARDLRILGVDPTLRPARRLGREIGTRSALLLVSMGRLNPQQFGPRYAQVLERAGGRLSVAAFTRRIGHDPRTIAHDLARVLGALDVRLNERAEPPPGLTTGLRDGLGTANGALTGTPETYNEVKWIANDLLGVIPNSPVPCHDEFQQTLTEAYDSLP